MMMEAGGFDAKVLRSTTTEGIRWYESAVLEHARETVVLLHGTGGAAYGSFSALLPMLATRHRVITLDFLDEWRGSGSDLDAYVDQVRDVVRDAGVAGPVNVLGYSFGAVVAAVLAAREPALVRSLILLAGWIRTDDQQRMRNSIWQSLSEDHHPALASFMALTAYSPQYVRSNTPAQLHSLVTAMGDGADRRHKMLFNRTVDIADEVPRIGAPTLVVGCRDDQMVPVHHARMLFGAVESARYVELPTGHAVVHERPAEVLRLCDRFFAEPGALPPGAVISPTHA
jgi:pimeloyl-ACP methyl ester carboxylesterase